MNDILMEITLRRRLPDFPEVAEHVFTFAGDPHGRITAHAVVAMAQEIIHLQYKVVRIAGNLPACDGSLVIDTGSCLLRIDVGGDITGLLYCLEQCNFPSNSKICWEDL